MDDAPSSLCAAFERTAALVPDAEAVVDSVSRLSFAQLEESSRRCVSLLRASGVVPGSRVAMLTVPSTVHITAWLGILRLGAIPVALHTRDAPSALSRICEKLGVECVLYDASLAAALPELLHELPFQPAVVSLRSALDSTASALENGLELHRDLPTFPAALDLQSPGGHDPAFIILSSGTTSLPKAVVHSHASALAAAGAVNDGVYGHLQAGHRVAVPFSTAFTGCYLSWLPPLVSGACTVFIERFKPQDLLSVISRERITHMGLTPTMWRMLLALDSDSAAYASLTRVQFAAEAMDSTTLARIRNVVTPNVSQIYGSTETFGAVTVIHDTDMHGAHLNSVGKPLPKTEVRVVRVDGDVDDTLSAGEVGNVVVNSPLLAQGIWDDPVKTHQLFQTGRDGRRWWCSNDLGYFDSDGYLFLEGRSDDMIISGGINIMPGAVEEVLLGHPAIVEAAVVGLPDPTWGQQVHAYVVSADPALTSEALSGFVLNSTLSRYQYPKRIHFVASLPRTATNKLDRRTLRQMGTAAETSGNANS